MPVGPQAESEGKVVGRHDHPDVLAGKRLAVTVVTPKGAALSREADGVVAPGILGEFGVLPGHVPFLSGLRAGVLSVGSGPAREVFAVGPGYLQVGAAGRVQVLVQRAAAPAEIDASAARRQADEATAKLKSAEVTGNERAVLDADLAWAQAQLKARGEG